MKYFNFTNTLKLISKETDVYLDGAYTINTFYEIHKTLKTNTYYLPRPLKISEPSVLVDAANTITLQNNVLSALTNNN